MGYTNCVIRQYETGEATFRQIDTGEYVVVVCFPHLWRRSHMAHAGHNNPKNTQPKRFKGIGQCFEYSKKHYPNCIIDRKVSLPLATSDRDTTEERNRWVDRIADVPVS